MKGRRPAHKAALRTVTSWKMGRSEAQSLVDAHERSHACSEASRFIAGTGFVAKMDAMRRLLPHNTLLALEPGHVIAHRPADGKACLTCAPTSLRRMPKHRAVLELEREYMPH